MTGVERLEQRLSAVERTLTGEVDIDEESLQAALDLSADVDAIVERLDGLEERIAKLEGDVQSVGGYLSEVDTVNADVERQALSAVATVDRLEDRLAELEETINRIDPGTREVQQVIEDTVAEVEAAETDSTESQRSTGEQSGDAAVDPRSVLDRISPSAGAENGSDGVDASGPAESGEASADDGSARPASSAAGGTGTDGADGHSNHDADGEAEKRPSLVSRRTADQERVDEMFEEAETAGNEEDGGVLNGLRDRLT